MLLLTTSKNYKKLDQIFIFFIIIVSLGLFYLNYTNRISINQLLFGEITLLLALVALLLPPGSDIKSLSLPIRFPIWVLPAIVYLVSEVEILLFRHTHLCYLLTLTLALILIVLADEKPAKKVAVTMSIISVSLIPLYSLYVPSFGNDTWRDIIWALQTLKVGHVTNTDIRHIAYPFPMVPLEYTLVSLISGLDPVWFSVVIGLMYLLQLPILVFLLTRRYSGVNDFKGALILLMASVVSIWSAWYIPEVYSLTLFLTALLLDIPLLQIPLLIASVFGHGGVATWSILVTVILFWKSKGKEKRIIGRILPCIIVIYITYIIYTTLFYAITSGYSNIIEAILAFLRGEKVLATTVGIPSLPTSSLGNLALSVLGILGLLIFLRAREPARTLAFVANMLLVIAYVTASVFPSELLRYLGLPSATILAILTPYALEFFKHRVLGNIYILILIMIAIFGFVYSGVFAPKNPFTAGPSQLNLLNSQNAQELLLVIPQLTPGNYFTDWLSGAYVWHYLIYPNSYSNIGFEYNGTKFFLGGVFGGILGINCLYLNKNFWESFKGYIIINKESVDLQCYQIYLRYIYTRKRSIYFNSDSVEIIKIIS